MRPLAWTLLAAVLAAGCSNSIDWPDPADPGDAVPLRGDVDLEPAADGFERPLEVLAHPADGRLLVVDQMGVVRATDSELFLDLSDSVGTCHLEQGLLGLAFSPTFDADRRVYAAYTTLPCEKKILGEEKGDLRLSRFAVPGWKADRGSEQKLLQIDEPYRNHNGGHLLFGPDGMLYLGVGDGGDAGDPDRNGQDPTTLLGSILRLDVSGDGAAAPPDNPFAQSDAGAGEVYVYGLRNPWRFDFDAAGGLWIADVGQNRFEEIDHLPAGAIAGANLGWSLYEGHEGYRDGEPDREPVFPVATYGRDAGCSVTGGLAVDQARTPDLPQDLDGAYLYSDFCSGMLWAVHANGTVHKLMQTGLQVTGFGEDADGNVYLTHWGGSVHRLRFG